MKLKILIKSKYFQLDCLELFEFLKIPLKDTLV